MDIDQARRVALENPKLKAAVVSSNRQPVRGAGITDDPDCCVEFFTLIKDAHARLRELHDEYLERGFRVTFGTLSKGLVAFQHESYEFEGAGIAIIRRNPSNGGLRRAREATKV
jgi:hypothetical protein